MADFDAVEPRPVVLVVVVEVDGLLHRAHVNAGEPAQGEREMAVGARIVHGPEDAAAAFLPVCLRRSGGRSPGHLRHSDTSDVRKPIPSSPGNPAGIGKSLYSKAGNSRQGFWKFWKAESAPRQTSPISSSPEALRKPISALRIPYFASRQFGPTPISTSSGTFSSYAPSISCLTSEETASDFLRRAFEDQFVVHLQQHGAPVSAGLQAAHRCAPWRA